MRIDGGRLTSVRWLTWILAGLALTWALGRAFPAAGQSGDAYQQWIHDNVPRCCDHRDCAPATVTMTFTGWQVAGGRNIVPFAQVIKWPFAVPYACVINGHVRCLFMDGGT